MVSPFTKIRKTAISYQQKKKKKTRVDRDNPQVGCTLRTIAFANHSRGRLFAIQFPKQ
jgi:hypothetical protein